MTDLSPSTEPDHVIVVHLPASSFATSQEAETALHNIITDMCKTLHVLGPRKVEAQDRSSIRSGLDIPSRVAHLEDQVRDLVGAHQ